MHLYSATNDFISQVVFFHEGKDIETQSISNPDNSAIRQILIQTIFIGIRSHRLRIAFFTFYFGTLRTTGMVTVSV
jgi:hypothetical protein